MIHKKKNNVIAVTGSNGFVGNKLILALKKRGLRYIELDLKNGVDLTDWDSFNKIDKFDIMIHLAANTYVPDSYDHTVRFLKNNILSTLNMLELCRMHKSKIIFASSYVYGNPVYLPVDENHPIEHFNPYASSKIICEELCNDYSRFFNLKVIILRVFNIYGQGQPSSFLISSILSQISTGTIMLNDPEPKRDYVHVDDLINAYLAAMEYDPANLEVFNISSGISYSVREIIELIKQVTALSLVVNYSGDKRSREVYDTVGDNSKARDLLHWNPEIDMKKGLTDLFHSELV